MVAFKLQTKEICDFHIYFDVCFYEPKSFKHRNYASTKDADY